MLLRLRIPILFRHSEIDDVNDVGGFRRRSSDEEIVRFDIAVDEVLLVDDLDPR